MKKKKKIMKTFINKFYKQFIKKIGFIGRFKNVARDFYTFKFRL